MANIVTCPALPGPLAADPLGGSLTVRRPNLHGAFTHATVGGRPHCRVNGEGAGFPH